MEILSSIIDMDCIKYNSIKASLNYGSTNLNDNNLLKKIKYNLTSSELYEYALLEHNTFITNTGALSVLSGEKCGRSPNDKKIDYDEKTYDCWWKKGTPNNKITKQLAI